MSGRQVAPGAPGDRAQAIARLLQQLLEPAAAPSYSGGAASTAYLLQRLDSLTDAIQLLAQNMGTRLNREQFAHRLGIHRNTLSTRLQQDRSMPRPGADGRWLLSEIMQWEQRQAQRHWH